MAFFNFEHELGFLCEGAHRSLLDGLLDALVHGPPPLGVRRDRLAQLFALVQLAVQAEPFRVLA